MDPQTLRTLETAQEAVGQLVDACRRRGPLHRESPRLVGQVSRTAKWLLNAVRNLQQTLNNSPYTPPSVRATSYRWNGRTSKKMRMAREFGILRLYRKTTSNT